MEYKKNPIETIENLNSLRLSPSSINSFRGCPRRWYQEYILALPTPANAHLLKGSLIHKVLEEIFNIKVNCSGENFRKTFLSDSLTILEKQWKENEPLFKLIPEDLNAIHNECKIIIERFVNKFCDNIQYGITYGKFSNERHGFMMMRPQFRELWIDDQFKMKFGGGYLYENKEKIPIENSLCIGGFIDSVQKDFDGNTILVDYKTSNKYKNVLSDDYVIQLSIYAYMWEKQFGSLPKFVGINYLRFDESFYILVTPSLIKNAVAEIKSIRRQINEFGLDENNYYKKESKLCEYCPFREKCLSGD